MNGCGFVSIKLYLYQQEVGAFSLWAVVCRPLFRKPRRWSEQRCSLSPQRIQILIYSYMAGRGKLFTSKLDLVPPLLRAHPWVQSQS